MQDFSGHHGITELAAKSQDRRQQESSFADSKKLTIHTTHCMSAPAGHERSTTDTNHVATFAKCEPLVAGNCSFANIPRILYSCCISGRPSCQERASRTFWCAGGPNNALRPCTSCIGTCMTFWTRAVFAHFPTTQLEIVESNCLLLDYNFYDIDRRRLCACSYT